MVNPFQKEGQESLLPLLPSSPKTAPASPCTLLANDLEKFRPFIDEHSVTSLVPLKDDQPIIHRQEWESCSRWLQYDEFLTRLNAAAAHYRRQKEMETPFVITALEKLPKETLAFLATDDSQKRFGESGTLMLKTSCVKAGFSYGLIGSALQEHLKPVLEQLLEREIPMTDLQCAKIVEGLLKMMKEDMGTGSHVTRLVRTYTEISEKTGKPKQSRKRRKLPQTDNTVIKSIEREFTRKDDSD